MTYTPQYLADETLKVGTDKINANFESLVETFGAASGLATLDENSKLSSGQIPASIVGALVYQGVWDCSTEAYPLDPSKGEYWVCSVDGTIDGTGFLVHDWLIFDGTTWDKIDNQCPVLSVNQKVGAVSLSASDVSAIPDTYITTFNNAIDALGGYIDGTAGENLSAYKLVYAFGGKYHIATNNDTAIKADVVGITLDNILQDASGPIQLGDSIISNNSWSFNQHTQLFLGTSGNIIEESVLTGNEIAKPIGFSISPTTIFFGLQLGYSNNESVVIDGDQIEVDYIPSNYTPTIVPETLSVVHLASHLKGIDDAIAALYALLSD